MDAEIAALAAAAATTLAPALPTLVEIGKGMSGEIGKRTVGTVLGSTTGAAAALWRLLKPRVDESPALTDVISDVALNPNDPDAVAALRRQLTRLLETAPDLAVRIRPLVDLSSASVIQTVTGHGNIVAGREITGNVINASPSDRRRD